MPKGETPRGKASKGKGKQSKVVAPQDPSAVSNALLQQAVDELKKLSGGHLEVKESLAALHVRVATLEASKNQPVTPAGPSTSGPSPTQQASTHQVHAPPAPTPQVPAPPNPTPQVPGPQAPTPQVFAPLAPTPQVPTPQQELALQGPIHHVSTEQPPTLQTGTTQAQSTSQGQAVTALGKPGSEAPVPLGLFLRDSIKNQIREWRYVDFKTMLDDELPPAASYELLSKQGDTVVFADKSSSAQAKKLVSFTTWCKAWNTYVAVATDLHPMQGLAAKMLKHFEVVQELKLSGKRWRYYDERFRKLLEKGWTSWGSAHQATWAEASAQQDEDVATSSRAFFAAGASTSHEGSQREKIPVSALPQSKFPKGVCFDHHTSSSCRKSAGNCQFSHICFNGNCGGYHAFHKCPKQFVMRPFRVMRDTTNTRERRRNGKGAYTKRY